MPRSDVYAAAGIFCNKHKLAQDLANAVMRWEKVPPINLFKNNTAAFISLLKRDYRPAAVWSRRTMHVEPAFATNRFFSSVMVHST